MEIIHSILWTRREYVCECGGATRAHPSTGNDDGPDERAEHNAAMERLQRGGNPTQRDIIDTTPTTECKLGHRWWFYIISTYIPNGKYPNRRIGYHSLMGILNYWKNNRHSIYPQGWVTTWMILSRRRISAPTGWDQQSDPTALPCSSSSSYLS